MKQKHDFWCSWYEEVLGKLVGPKDAHKASYMIWIFLNTEFAQSAQYTVVPPRNVLLAETPRKNLRRGFRSD